MQTGSVTDHNLNLFHDRLDQFCTELRHPCQSKFQEGCFSPRYFTTTSGSEVFSSSASDSSLSITSARLDKTPTCSSAEAAMPMTMYTFSPSSHSTPSANCRTEIPVCRICSRFSYTPCGMATPFPRLVDMDSSRLNIPSIYSGKTHPEVTSNSPALRMASA